MNKQNKQNKFSPEVRERSVRLVQEHRGEYPSLWAAVESIAPKIGCVPSTLLEWVKRSEINNGTREGLTSSERDRLKALERENRELRRANEILKRFWGFVFTFLRLTGLSARWDTVIKKTLRASEQERADVAAARLVWQDWQKICDCARLIFLDETGASTDMTRRHGRSPVGES